MTTAWIDAQADFGVPWANIVIARNSVNGEAFSELCHDGGMLKLPEKEVIQDFIVARRADLAGCIVVGLQLNFESHQWLIGIIHPSLRIIPDGALWFRPAARALFEKQRLELCAGCGMPLPVDRMRCYISMNGDEFCDQDCWHQANERS